jgi:hypothetical protein
MENSIEQRLSQLEAAIRELQPKINPSTLINPVLHRDRLATSATKIHDCHSQKLYQQSIPNLWI